MKHFPHLFATILFNLGWMMGLGTLTLDSFATFYTKVCAVIFSILLPLAINSYWPSLSRGERSLRFGGGLVTYFFLALVAIPFTDFLSSMLLPCLIVSMSLLWWGVRLPAFPKAKEATQEDKLDLRNTGDLPAPEASDDMLEGEFPIRKKVLSSRG